MRKLLAAAAIAIVLSLILAIFFLPKQINTSVNATFLCSINSVNRYIVNDSNWVKWWPGTFQKNDHSIDYYYDEYKYSVLEQQYNAAVIRIQKEGLSIDTKMIFFPLKLDSVTTTWTYSVSTNSNPISKIYLFFIKQKINGQLKKIVNSMKSFLDNPDKVYGVKIHEEIVKDTILVTTNFSSLQYPTMAQVYKAIGDIKNYIALNHARETNFPMLHVRIDSGLYKAQVAIPVNTTIPATATFPIKRMVPGKILVTQVTGGDYTARDAIDEVNRYMTDYHMTSPAIPFESLVTDRMTEPDTTKWTTKIYYPVF